jgi:hypothetical protein
MPEMNEMIYNEFVIVEVYSKSVFVTRGVSEPNTIFTHK